MTMKQRIILLIIPLILLSGCGAALATAGAARGKEPTNLQVSRVNLVPGTHYLPFSPRTITDQQAVQRLYHAVQALPSFTLSGSQIEFCPHDSGLEYQLDFFQKHALMQAVIFYPGGCSLIRLGENDVRVYTKSFVRLFVQTIGISEAELVPKPLFSCTPHSPCPSPIPYR